MTHPAIADDYFMPISHPETEASIFAAIALDNSKMAPVSAVLSDKHWYSDTNRWIWRAMVTVWERDGAVSMVAVANELKSLGRLSQIGGTPQLAELVWHAPYFENVVEHAEMIRDAYIARETAGLLLEASVAIRSGADTWRGALEELRVKLRCVRE